MKIYYTASPSSEDIDFLTQQINQETFDKGSAYHFAFFMRNNYGDIIVGCNGSVIFGSVYTDQLWVHPDKRKQGLGRALMEKVHDLGRQEGCTMATLTTLSSQAALNFYEQLGYQCDFKRPGYTQGADCLFLMKRL